MKEELIAKYKTQINSIGDQKLDIPAGRETDFWDWFERKSRIYNYKKIRNKLYVTNIPILENFCFKNSFRIAQGFVKRLFYFEGFTYHSRTDNCIRHAFNVCENDTVFDYTLFENPENRQDYYIGIRIPLNFAREIYKLKTEGSYSQYPLLVAYFMMVYKIDGYIQYTSP